jgi:hypothetical protein
MRNILYIFIVSILISCSNNNEQKIKGIQSKQELNKKTEIKVTPALIDEYAVELKDWLDYYEKYSISLDRFIFMNEASIPNISANVDTFNFENDIYEPYYKYSSGNDKILDLVSYNLIIEKNEKGELISNGGGVDSEVSIMDLKNKQWRRILFVGPLYVIEDGFWLTNNQFLIVGQYNETDQNKYKPVIWFVDLDKDIIQTFEYEKYINNLKCSYISDTKYKGVKMNY